MEKEMCSKLGCKNEAKWNPVLLLYSESGGTPAKAALVLPLCGLCMMQTRPSDLITDESWGMLVVQFRTRGKVIPQRELTEVTPLRIKGT